MKLTLREIKSEASTQAAYNRGVDYAEKGKVRGLEISQSNSGDTLIQATVCGGKNYAVSGKVDSQGEIKDFRCNCLAFAQYSGLCKHCAAVLYKAYYMMDSENTQNTSDTNSEDDASAKSSAVNKQEKPAMFENESFGNEYFAKKIAEALKKDQIVAEQKEKLEASKVEDSNSLKQIIANYSRNAVLEAVQQTAMLEDKVHIEPKLVYSDHIEEITLSIMIGNKKMYVVRDLAEFASACDSSKEFGYGKTLKFVHSPENFAEESRPLLRFLLENIRELSETYNSYDYYCRINKKAIALSARTLDNFFTICENKVVSFEYGNKVRQLTFSPQNPPINIKVKSFANGAGVTLTLYGVDALFSGDMHAYVVSKNTMHRCDTNMSNDTDVLIEGLMRADRSMVISKKTLPAFCSEVLPVVQGYINFSGDTDVFAEYAPVPLEIEMFFDMPTADIASCNVIFSYGSQKFEPDLSAANNVYNKNILVARDIKQELLFKLMVERYFTSIDKSRMWIDSEEGIYNLLEDGLSEFSEIAKIEVTDRFRKHRITTPPRVCVGVALDGGLLELTMDTDAFSIDELAGALKAYREKRKYFRLKDGEFLRLSDGALAGVSQIADGLNLTGKELAKGKISIPAYRSLYLDRVLRANENIRFDRNSAFKNLVRNIKSVEDSDFEVPESLSDTLRNYQKTGFRWLKTMESYHFCGILADDMGLGKTIQVIALILSSFEQGIKKPSLIVCPSSLVFNWENEFHKFAPSLLVRTIAGTTAKRHEDIKSLTDQEIAVTSYDLLKRDIEQYENVNFQYEIIDEAQYIKNHNTQNAKAVKVIKSVQRFALTGTPIENRLSELWSIFDFLMPGYCFSYNKFRQRFELPIVRDKDEVAREQFGRMVAPFLLRRLKLDVLSELPPKEETVLRTVLTGEQKRLYAANQSMLKAELRDKLSETSGQQGKLKILALLTRLRQICCDPSLCYDDYKDGSAKLEMCMELISEAVDGGHKVLLFSQFTSMLKILSDRLDHEGISYYTLQGSTSKSQRINLVDKFNSDQTPIFLISLKAGGTGLNLTGADIVIHYDPWWNIAAQNQATDRAHRIGQKNSVHVYKLVAQDTIEERILNLQETKSELADSIVSTTGDANILSMSTDDIRSLLE